jgi:hypothetical protein
LIRLLRKVTGKWRQQRFAHTIKGNAYHLQTGPVQQQSLPGILRGDGNGGWFDGVRHLGAAERGGSGQHPQHQRSVQRQSRNRSEVAAMKDGEWAFSP